MEMVGNDESGSEGRRKHIYIWWGDCQEGKVEQKEKA